VILPQQAKNEENPWVLLFCDFFKTFYLRRMMKMYLQRGLSIKTYLDWKKKNFLLASLRSLRKRAGSGSGSGSVSQRLKVRIRGSGYASRSVPKYHESGALKEHIGLIELTVFSDWRQSTVSMWHNSCAVLRIRDVLSRIRLFSIPDPGVKKAPDPGSATLLIIRLRKKVSLYPLRYRYKGKSYYYNWFNWIFRKNFLV